MKTNMNGKNAKPSSIAALLVIVATTLFLLSACMNLFGEYKNPYDPKVGGETGTTVSATSTSTSTSTSTTTTTFPLPSMVLVPAGTFFNGIANMTVSNFYMSQYAITQAQYQARTGANPSFFTGDTSRPVERVTWYDAVEFCNLLSTAEGKTRVYTITGRTPASGYPITSATVTATWSNNGYRLPTEAEWMWAAMGGNSDARVGDIVTGINTGGYTKGYAGSIETAGGQANIGNRAWFTSNSGSTTHPVGQKLSNELGLYDMSGNVWQWCWDWDAAYPAASTDYRGPASGMARIKRGGSWLSAANTCTVDSSFGDTPNIRYGDIGFRVVRR